MALFPPIDFEDFSGSITTGGTAQDVYPTDAHPIEGLEFYNTSDTVMYIDWDRPATPTKGIPVQPGQGWFSTVSLVPKGRMSVLCATTGKTFVCKLM